MSNHKTNNKNLQIALIILAIFGVAITIYAITVITNPNGELFTGNAWRRVTEQPRLPTSTPNSVRLPTDQSTRSTSRDQNSNRSEIQALTSNNPPTKKTTSDASSTSQGNSQTNNQLPTEYTRPKSQFTVDSEQSVTTSGNQTPQNTNNSENTVATEFNQVTPPTPPTPKLQITKIRNNTVGQFKNEFLNFSITTEDQPVTIKRFIFEVKTTPSPTPTTTKNPNCPSDPKEQCFSCSIVSDSTLIAPNGQPKQTKFTPFDSGYLIPKNKTENFYFQCNYSILPDSGAKILTKPAYLEFEHNGFTWALDQNSPELKNIIGDEITITEPVKL